MRAGSQSLTTALVSRACYRLDPVSDGPEGSSVGSHAFEGESSFIGSLGSPLNAQPFGVSLQVSSFSCTSSSSPKCETTKPSPRVVGLRVRSRLVRQFGRGNWRKRKGFARIRLENGHEIEAELHWYEAHGVGKRGMKIKRYLRP
jgi:hypothetical protein